MEAINLKNQQIIKKIHKFCKFLFNNIYEVVSEHILFI